MMPWLISDLTIKMFSPIMHISLIPAAAGLAVPVHIPFVCLSWGCWLWCRIPWITYWGPRVGMFIMCYKNIPEGCNRSEINNPLCTLLNIKCFSLTGTTGTAAIVSINFPVSGLISNAFTFHPLLRFLPLWHLCLAIVIVLLPWWTDVFWPVSHPSNSVPFLAFFLQN